jgi:hypothetical protein
VTIGKLLLGTVCCLGVLVIVSGIVAFARGGALNRFNRARIATVCINCQGRGYIQPIERNLEFDGSGFTDNRRQPEKCPVCKGGGRIFR